MKNLFTIIILTIGLFFTSKGSAQFSFSDNFEFPTPLADGTFDFGNGWLVFIGFPEGQGMSPADFEGFGPFTAPNGTGGLGQIDTNEAAGGGCNMNQYYNVFSQYNATDAHTFGRPVESSNFQQHEITADDVGRTYIFQFDHIANQDPDPMNNLIPGDVNVFALEAFIRVIDSQFFFDQSPAAPVQTGTSNSWTTSSLSITIDASWVGDFLQFGFFSSATNFAPTGVWYDNVSIGETVPAPMLPAVAGTSCDDGNPDTVGDVLNADCECVGGAPIPTLGEWGLILMSLMLFIVGLVYIRQTSLQPVQRRK